MDPAGGAVPGAEIKATQTEIGVSRFTTSGADGIYALANLATGPYRVEVTDVIHAGTNDLEVRVTTLLVNRLIGDEQLPAENEYDSRTRAIKRLPDWYVEGKPKPPGGRSTFSTWKFFNGDDPLVESGLLGPVRILTSVSAVFE